MSASIEMDQREFFDNFEPVVVPKLLKRTYIDYIYLTELRDTDFDLKSLTMINFREKESDGLPPVRLKLDRPYFVLFTKQDPESQRYLKMWLKIAESIKSEFCEMSFCNLEFERGISEKFNLLAQRRFISHPFYWARYQTMPFILVYRDGWPQGFYNGGFFFQDLINFAATEVPDPTRDLERFQKSRPSYLTALRKREMELMNELDDERQREETVEKKEKLKSMVTSEQSIAHAVGFD